MLLRLVNEAIGHLRVAEIANHDPMLIGAGTARERDHLHTLNTLASSSGVEDGLLIGSEGYPGAFEMLAGDPALLLAAALEREETHDDAGVLLPLPSVLLLRDLILLFSRAQRRPSV